MSLDISQLIEMEAMLEGADFVRFRHDQQGIPTMDQQPDFFTMHMWDKFDKLDAEDKAQDVQESIANEIAMGEEATKAVTTIPEPPHSPAVVKEEEEPVSKDQDSFSDKNTSLTEYTNSSTAQTASPMISPPKSDKTLPLELLEDTMTTDQQFEDCLKTLGCLIPEHFPQDEPHTQLKKPRRHFKDFAKYSPPTTDMLNAIIQNEEVVHQVKQPTHEIRKQAPQIEAAYQVEHTTQKDQPTQQAQLLHAEEQPVRLINAAQQVNKSATHVEKAVPQIQSSHPINIPPCQLHVPMHPNNKPDLQHSTKNAQGKAKRASRSSTPATASASTTMFADVHHLQTSQASPEAVSGFQSYSEPEAMDGVLAHELNQCSYIAPEEQSQHGLAGLFGLTLDQAQSGMRNKKFSVRNTVIEKPKLTATFNPLQYAGVKKSKSPKVKVPASLNHVQTEEEKSRRKPTAAIAGEQTINKPDVATLVKKKLPPFVTEEQWVTIVKVANAKLPPVYHQAVQEGIWNAQQQTLQLMALQAANQPSGQHALNTSPDQSVQLNPYHLQQQALQTLQVKHTDQNAYYPQEQHVEQVIGHVSSMPGNHTASNNLQQQRTYMIPGRSPMQGNRPSPHNMLQGAYTAPYYSVVQGSQGVSYPSPQTTPQPAGQASSYGSPNNTCQAAGKQSPSIHQMAAFNVSQQFTQTGIYSNTQQAWQLAQQVKQVQPQSYYPPLQQSQPTDRYYAPIPAPQPNGYVPRYDPQNQAQIVVQQHQMQQNQAQSQQIQVQSQQIQQSGTQYQPTIQDNLTYSANMVAQANAANPKRQFRVEDFLNQRH